LRSKRNILALYKHKDEEEWRLITREVSTKSNAGKKAETYKRSGYEIKYIKVD